MLAKLIERSSNINFLIFLEKWAEDSELYPEII